MHPTTHQANRPYTIQTIHSTDQSPYRPDTLQTSHPTDQSDYRPVTLQTSHSTDQSLYRPVSHPTDQSDYRPVTLQTRPTTDQSHYVCIRFNILILGCNIIISERLLYLSSITNVMNAWFICFEAYRARLKVDDK